MAPTRPWWGLPPVSAVAPARHLPAWQIRHPGDRARPTVDHHARVSGRRSSFGNGEGALPRLLNHTRHSGITRRRDTRHHGP
ncbi:hypothetical protein BN12_2270003 [Nostocoides japonicum T1-X7]|uniref:Uncharacterized protein n=1 Tax=Nostocoides japonicum T1-X7 TaxID=1194083 RepID=A0A077M0U6_9MICO|nr:hypothetical protein BN12_2270003 [Tetrasphaera japonica T1-X7]